MPGRSTLLCDSIVTYLEAQTFNLTPTYIRANFVAARAEEHLTPTVYVTPVGILQQIATREFYYSFFTVGITLVQLLNTMNISEQDELVELSEQLPMSLVSGFRFEEMAVDAVEDEAARTLFDEIQMETGTIFLAQTTINFRSRGN